MLLIEVGIAIFVRDDFVRPYIGDVLAVMVVYAGIRTIWPRGVKWLPAYVFLFAVGVEVSQYVGLVRWLGVQDNRIVSVLLGGVFDLKDVLCYGVGCLIVWGVQRVVLVEGRE